MIAQRPSLHCSHRVISCDRGDIRASLSSSFVTGNVRPKCDKHAASGRHHR